MSLTFAYLVGMAIGYVLGWNQKKISYLKANKKGDEKE